MKENRHKKSDHLEYEDKMKRAYQELKRAYKEIQESYREMVIRLAMIAEYRAEGTGTHLVRIADYSTEIAHGLGLPKKDMYYLKF